MTKTTGHVALACYLWFSGFKIENTEWVDGMCHWRFINSQELEDAIHVFFAGSALVNAREFFPKVTEFKRNMYRDKPLTEEQGHTSTTEE